MRKMCRIACVSIPCFVAEVERLRLPHEERPLIVREGNRVLGACAKAEASGVGVGNPVRHALARCPDALVMPADPARYDEAWERVLGALALHSPLVESESRGLAYLDAGGMGPLYGSEAAWCQAILAEVGKASGLEPKVGVAGSKFAARMASMLADAGDGLSVPEGGDRAFLAPLPVEKLPLSEETLRRLSLLGIRTMAQFARLPATSVAEQFGPEALQPHRWARGYDDRPLAGQPRKALEIHLDFDVPESCREPLLQAMLAAIHRSLQELHRSGLTVRRLAVEFRLDNGETQTRTAWLTDSPGTSRVRTVLEGLLNNLGSDGTGIAQVHLRMTGIRPATPRQPDLFAHAEGRNRLEDTLRRLAGKYAPGCVLRARILCPDAPLLRDRYTLEDMTP